MCKNGKKFKCFRYLIHSVPNMNSVKIFLWQLLTNKTVWKILIAILLLTIVPEIAMAADEPSGLPDPDLDPL